MEGARTTPCYAVADLTVDVGRRAVFRGGTEVPLPKLSFEFLMALIEAAPNVISSEQLLHRVWQGVIVGPETVSQRAKMLRDALGDNASQPRYVAVQRGLGYRLVPAAIRVHGPKPPGEALPADAFAHTDARAAPGHWAAMRRRFRVPVLLGASALVMSAIAYVAADRFWLRSSDGTEPRANASARRSDAPPTVPRPEKSVAVMPFIDMSADKDKEFLADGLSEELINRLSNLPDVRVPARTSSFFFKNKQTTIAGVGAALRVAYVLEGSVRTDGDKLRVTARLVRADSGYHVWSMVYDSPLSGILRVEDDIAEAVVAALKVSLSPQSERRESGSINTRVYSLITEARFRWNRATTKDTKVVLSLLREALRLDPSNARAYAMLSRTLRSELAWATVPRERAYAEALHAAERSLALDPLLSDAHLALGTVRLIFEWDWNAAQFELSRAHELNPHDPYALIWLSNLAATFGHSDESASLLQQAIELDPLNIYAYMGLAGTNYDAGRMPEAEEAARRVLELNPAADGGHETLGEILLRRGVPPDEAVAEIQRAPPGDEREMALIESYQWLGRKAQADRAFARFKAAAGDRALYKLASLHAMRGEADEAFRWADRAFARRDVDLHCLLGDPHWKDLRLDPRFDELKHRMKLP